MTLTLSLMLIVSSLICPVTGSTSERSRLRPNAQPKQQSGQTKKVTPRQPQPGAPAVSLPNLTDARNRPSHDPKPAKENVSTQRSRRKPLESRHGLKVGDPLPRQRKSHHATKRAAKPALFSPMLNPPTFTDDPLTGGTAIRAIHITELRQYINDARAVANLAPWSWGEAIVAGTTPVRASHVTEMRQHLDEARAALGLSTGGYTDPNLSAGYWISAVHINELRTRVRDILALSTSDQFVQNFLQSGLGRSPHTDEFDYWKDIFRAAYQQGQPSMFMSTTEFGMTVFDSAEYAARNRSNHDYVYDLYMSYLMRDPTGDSGWGFWTGQCDAYGRAEVRKAFEDSIEFHNIVATLSASGTPSANAASLATAQADLFNRSGNQLQSRDCEWSVPLLSLPGRAGLDLGVSISYSSLVWMHSGPYIYFDSDNESLSPGFTIGFPTVQWRAFDAHTARNVYLLTAGGRRTELRQVGTSNVYEAADSSYLQLIDYGGSLLLRTTDGTQISFAAFANGWQVTLIEDRNGNVLNVQNNWRGDIANITDTLGRVVSFNYDENANLTSITQNWNGVAHTWATFGWSNHSMSSGLSGQVVGTFNGEVNPVLTQIGLDDGTRYNFEYNGAAQVSVIRRYTFDPNVNDYGQRSYLAYDYEGTADCPRVYRTRVWAENWTGINGVPGEVVTQFADNGDNSHQMTAPDGMLYKEFYGTSWQRGLVTQSEIWSGGVRQKWTATAFDQDNTSVSYQVNPRVTETNIYDAGGNRRRTTIDYSVASYRQYGLPDFVSEYAANGTTEIRRTYTDYNLSQAYLDRRIIGLVSARRVLDPVAGQWLVKTTYGYDDAALIDPQATTAAQHDQSFSSSFLVRGNLTAVLRWDVNDLDNGSKALTTQAAYDSAGSMIYTRDPLNHVAAFHYGDWFSDGNDHNTFAYVTTATDPDGNNSSVQYNYDFGAKTRVQGPPPQNQANGIIQTFSYDGAARLQQVTTLNNNAYTRYLYGPTYVQSLSTVNNVADEAYTGQFFDGVGHLYAVTHNHPGSVGGYNAVITLYDKMGRAVQQSNPTEITGAGVPAGDDTAGYQYNVANTFDWKGRPLRTYNMDGTYKEASYAGCGCAGGEVVTIEDEVGRQQKIYSDVLGRQIKTEVLNTNGSVYSTTTASLNARDQATLVRQWAGAENGGGAYQDTTMGYDGYGRLQTKHAPEQRDQSDNPTYTTYSYNSDDTINSVTDARGASATYIYNNYRHLVNEIHYSAPSGVTATANVTFTYDAVGNRTSMTDGLGSKSYSYNQLSQLMSETRTFNGVGSFTLSYDYNCAGELKTVVDPWGATVSYGFDSGGRLNSVNGTGYGNISQLISDMQYRAWGTLKSETYGNGYVESAVYDQRLRMTAFQIAKPNSQLVMSHDHQYYADGQLQFSHDALDDRFDRAYMPDQEGRLVEAFSGSEARDFVNHTNSGFPTGPYRQSYQYTPFDQISQEANRIWSDTETTTSTYVNNRRQGWSYDLDGRLVSTDDGSFTRDVTGQIVTQSSGTSTRQNKFDGDGQLAWTSLTRPNFRGTPMTTMTYYLEATPLGSLAVAELGSSGQKTTGFVYAAGRKLAQASAGDLSFTHGDPVVESRGNSFSNGAYGPEAEYDSNGVNVGFSEPVMQGGGDPDPGAIGWLGGNFGSGSSCSGADPNCMTCYLDGIEQPDCGHVAQLIAAGAAEQCPDNDCGPRSIWDQNAQKFVGVLPLTTDPKTGLWMVTGTVDQYSKVNIKIGDEYFPGAWKKVGTRSFTGFLDPEQPAPGSFLDCFSKSQLRTKHVNGQYADGTHFTKDAADLLTEIHNSEPETSLALLAVTLMNENTNFQLDLKPNTNPNKKGVDSPKDWWDIGPFQLNTHYTVMGLALGQVSMKDLEPDDIFGKTVTKNQPFTGKPLANGRTAARVLQSVGGNTDRDKAINYAQRNGRGDSYDSFAPLFNNFFNCYKGF
jgi:YD repeat-containing protein